MRIESFYSTIFPSIINILISKNIYYINLTKISKLLEYKSGPDYLLNRYKNKIKLYKINGELDDYCRMVDIENILSKANKLCPNREYLLHEIQSKVNNSYKLIRINNELLRVIKDDKNDICIKITDIERLLKYNNNYIIKYYSQIEEYNISRRSMYINISTLEKILLRSYKPQALELVKELKKIKL